MIVGVYGLGYWWASRDFAKHWPVIAVGFRGKIFGPIGFFQSVLTGALPWSWGWMILTNDLIWWIPFGAMLYLAFKFNSDPLRRSSGASVTQDQQREWTLQQANSMATTATGETINELSSKQDVLLVFLRHAGCTFCRETLDELQKARSEWQSRNMLPVVVHMGSTDQGVEMMKQYQLQDCPVISDPDCRLFRAYQLPRGNWRQLFGLRIWIEGFKAAIIKGYGFGKLVGDGFQLSGAFVVRKGQIVHAFPSRDAADSCSWKPALNTLLLLSFLCFLSCSDHTLAQSPAKDPSVNNEYSITEVKDGDRIVWLGTSKTHSGSVVEVHSNRGIGGFKLTKSKGSWPEELKLRLHTKGLEQIRLVLGGKSKTYTGEFHSSLLKETWSLRQGPRSNSEQDISGDKILDSKVTCIRVIGAQGDAPSSVQVPLDRGQFFEWTIPKDWLADENPEWIRIEWIDFFRN
jgi:hypothetical protein